MKIYQLLIHMYNIQTVGDNSVSDKAFSKISIPQSLHTKFIKNVVSPFTQVQNMRVLPDAVGLSWLLCTGSVTVVVHI